MRWLAGLLVWLMAATASASTILESTDGIEVVTTTAATIDYTASFADHTSSAFTPSKSAGQITSATTTTVVAAPAASTQRQLKQLTLRNIGTASNTLTVQRDVSGANRVMFQAALGVNETLLMDANGAFTVHNSAGTLKTQATDISGYTGRVYPLQKAATAKDAAGYWYSNVKDAGIPGAYSLGAPGLNGFNTDCGTVSNATNPVGAAQAGAHYLPDPASGSYYLTQAGLSTSIADLLQLIDPLWYNTGIAVTTTTGQTVTMPGALPARDINGSTDGEGVMAALYSTAANTNAAVITNTTLTYTDSEGNTGNTAIFSAQVGWQAPATPVIGTWMPFQLAAGDRGIRSVQTITLGTSYGAGSLSLVLYRPLVTIPNPVAAVGGVLGMPNFGPPGIRLYNDTCVWPITVGAVTADVISGTYSIMER